MLNEPDKTPAPGQQGTGDEGQNKSSTPANMAEAAENASVLIDEPPVYGWPSRRIESAWPGYGDKRACAVWLAEAGFRVFRLVANEKLPIGGSHPFYQGLIYSTSAPEIASGWWTGAGKSACNIGIRTDGRRLVMIDLDVHRKTLEEQIKVLTALCGGVLPPTWTVRTASGGWHLYFLIPEGALEPGEGLACSVSNLAPGIDVRGFHGLGVAPGSVNRDGLAYTWGEGLAPGEVDLADIPTPL